MARRAQANPISLFSFQDIITSVTGIMILLTLLMALELSQRSLQSPSVQTAVVTDQLETAVVDSEQEIARLEADLANRDKKLQELAAIDERRLLDESADIEQQVSQLTASSPDLAKQAEQAARRREQAEITNQDRQKDIDTARALTERAAEVEAKLAKLQSTNRVIYNPAPGSSKSAWLVEITDSELRAAPLGQATSPTVFKGNASARLAAFRAWARTRDRRGEYFVLLVKPSGIDAFDELHEALGKLGFDLGFDIVDAAETVIDDQTGAGI